MSTHPTPLAENTVFEGNEQAACSVEEMPVTSGMLLARAENRRRELQHTLKREIVYIGQTIAWIDGQLIIQTTLGYPLPNDGYIGEDGHFYRFPILSVQTAANLPGK